MAHRFLSYSPPADDEDTFSFESDHDIDCHCDECDPWLNEDATYEFKKESA